MIKRTLLFSNPSYLKSRNEQLLVSFPEKEKEEQSVPIEDVGIVVLEDPQITITNHLLGQLVDNKVAVVNCNAQHLPTGLLQPLSGHTELTERYRMQIQASTPLKKNLWQQTVQAKISNQAYHLGSKSGNPNKLLQWAKDVKSGDKDNIEALAAAYYWPRIFGLTDFTRRPQGEPPNHLLNYGYAILRAVTARSLISTGLLPALGIFHRNKYNAYCLADDIMEPYRIFVDTLVYDLVQKGDYCRELTKEDKVHLLKIAAIDVRLDGKKSPLMVAMSRTTNSLFECFAGISRKIIYPVYER